MNAPQRTSTPQSRRERPAKPALTREGIIATALAMLRADGLAKVTMRRIAAALDTGAASLYVYIRDTEDLHAQILDALLDSVSGAVPAVGTWRERLTALLTGYALVLFKHPEIARMAMSTQPSGPHYLALVEAILALLHEGGVPDREAAWAVDLLLLFATANAVEHGIPRPAQRTAVEESALALKIATSDAALYPQIARLGNELLSGTGPDRFQWGVDVLLAGVIGTPRAPDRSDAAEGAS
jgi:AcrR family transcriptional regulator